MEIKSEDKSRINGLEDAIEEIRKDKDSVDHLLELFKESEGYVMKFPTGVNYGERAGAGQMPPYLSLDLLTPECSDLLLISRRGRESSLVLGKFGEVTTIYTPDENYKKLLKRKGDTSLMNPDKFAEYWLKNQTEIEMSVREETPLPKDRTWGTIPSSYFRSKLFGEDLLKLYRESLEQANRYGHILDLTSKGHLTDYRNYPYFKRDVLFFNRDLSRARKTITQVKRFDLVGMQL